MDYSNLIKVDLVTGIATREPVPAGLYGLQPISLLDIASWIDPSSEYYTLAWWPEDNQSPALAEYESYGAETLTPDAARQVVVSLRAVIPWTLEEIAADLAPKAAAAILKTNHDADGEYLAIIGERASDNARIESAARAFAAAGYAGTVPNIVACYALSNQTGETQTEQWAADQIIAEADARDAAMDAMYCARIARQADMRAATVNSELATAVAAWDAFIAGLRAQLGL